VEPRLNRFVRQTRQQWRWVRAEGVARFADETHLDAAARVRRRYGRWRYRSTHQVAPYAAPIFVFGAQRSGTTMLLRQLGRLPEVRIRNEADRVAFDRFQLRDDEVIRSLVERCGERYVIFKALCDSDRVARLLDDVGTPTPARAIWMYRRADGRVRSAVAKFQSADRDVLARVARGEADGLWQARGLSHENRELVESFDYRSMTPESGAALFWYVRNSLYFEQRLDAREDVALCSYDDLLQDAEGTLRTLCASANLPYRHGLSEGIAKRSSDPGTLAVDPRIRELCRSMEARLADAMLRRSGA
jgi:hypothetical protein